MIQGAPPRHVLCANLGGAVGREAGVVFRREGTCVCLWLIHVKLWQRPTHYCKAIILQFKKKIRKKKVA